MQRQNRSNGVYVRVPKDEPMETVELLSFYSGKKYYTPDLFAPLGLDDRISATELLSFSSEDDLEALHGCGRGTVLYWGLLADMLHKQIEGFYQWDGERLPKDWEADERLDGQASISLRTYKQEVKQILLAHTLSRNATLYHHERQSLHKAREQHRASFPHPIVHGHSTALSHLAEPSQLAETSHLVQLSHSATPPERALLLATTVQLPDGPRLTEETA